MWVSEFFGHSYGMNPGVFDEPSIGYDIRDTRLRKIPPDLARLYAAFGDEHVEEHFDYLSHVPFRITDRSGRYLRVNRVIIQNYDCDDLSSMVEEDGVSVVWRSDSAS